MRFLYIALEAIAAIASIALLVRYWPGARPHVAGFDIIAHRGVHHTYDGTDAGRHGCTAVHIDPVQHPYMENTLESIAAAFRAGATSVEIDFHDTSDGHIVVFHDWTLECRTNGTGVTREQPLAYLKGLDVGYGYTADGGKTFPLRGSGIGAMPTLEEVLDRFPDRQFLLDHKSGRVDTVRVLANVLRRYPDERVNKLSYWGPRYDELRALVPAIGTHVLPREAMKRCAYDYAKTLGVGEFPDSCANATLMFPAWALKYVWGFPDRFMQKALAAGSRVIVVGIETREAAASAIDLPVHGVMTDRIEVVGPALVTK